jgi:peptidoglycan/xylan/chitin deacetylase (PgdA/CDA1 family)
MVRARSLRGRSRLAGWAAGVSTAGVLLAALAAPGGAHARKPPGHARGVSPTSGAFQIRSASLAQQGQLLVWQVRLTQPFSPRGLARNRQTLCLLLGPARASAQVCVAGPARGSRAPRLLYSPISRAGVPGRARAVAATITRASHTQLTAAFLPPDVGLRYVRMRWQVISAAPPSPCGQTGGCVTPTCSASGGHSTGAGSACVTVFPRNPARLALHTPKLVGCAPSGAPIVSTGPRHVRQIALTFDDGPWNAPPTTEFLRVLEREHVPATFFEIGDQIATYDPTGAVARRMIADGDMLGDHSWSHPVVTSLSPGAQRAQLLDTVTAIRRQTGGFTPCLWRPPYGAVNGSLIALARSLGLITIMWDIDPRDWATPGVGAIYGNVVANAHNGAIVLQHFGGGPRYQTLAALPQEIATLRGEGYRFVTVTQMLGLQLVYR